MSSSYCACSPVSAGPSISGYGTTSKSALLHVLSESPAPLPQVLAMASAPGAATNQYQAAARSLAVGVVLEIVQGQPPRPPSSLPMPYLVGTMAWTSRVIQTCVATLSLSSLSPCARTSWPPASPLPSSATSPIPMAGPCYPPVAPRPTTSRSPVPLPLLA